jgi:ATP-dependent Clp endopeptidase proteolytic subunit ClpP
MATRSRKKTKAATPEVRKDILSTINKHFFPDHEEVSQVFIYLTGQITTKNCDDVIAELIQRNSPRLGEEKGKIVRYAPEEDVINIIINSEGGDLTAAFALVAVMEASVIPVRTIALGECASAGLVIFMAGHQRVICPNTSLMSHQLSTGSEGTYGSIKANMKAIQMAHDAMLRHYVRYTGLPLETIEKELLADTDKYLTPEEAASYKMCDLIADLK